MPQNSGCSALCVKLKNINNREIDWTTNSLSALHEKHKNKLCNHCCRKTLLIHTREQQIVEPVMEHIYIKRCQVSSWFEATLYASKTFEPGKLILNSAAWLNTLCSSTIHIKFCHDKSIHSRCRFAIVSIQIVEKISTTSVCFQIVFRLIEVCSRRLVNFLPKENQLQNFIALSVNKKINSWLWSTMEQPLNES